MGLCSAVTPMITHAHAQSAPHTLFWSIQISCAIINRIRTTFSLPAFSLPACFACFASSRRGRLSCLDLVPAAALRPILWNCCARAAQFPTSVRVRLGDAGEVETFAAPAIALPRSTRLLEAAAMESCIACLVVIAAAPILIWIAAMLILIDVQSA